MMPSAVLELFHQPVDVIVQRGELGELRVELRHAVVEPHFVVDKSLHPLGQRALRRTCQRIDVGRQHIARFAQFLDAVGDAALCRGERREPRVQLGIGFLQAGDGFRGGLDAVATLMALPDELRQLLQAKVERRRIVAAGDFGKRALDVVLAGVELKEQPLDRAAVLQHRREALLQRLLLAADGVDARLQVADFVALRLHLGDALGFGQPLLHRADRIFRIGAGEMMHRRVGIDLRFRQFLDALAHAVEPQLERLCRLALAHQGVAQPHRRGQQNQRHQHDDRPRHFVEQGLGPQRGEQGGDVRSPAHDQNTDREHEHNNANADEFAHAERFTRCKSC